MRREVGEVAAPGQGKKASKASKITKKKWKRKRYEDTRCCEACRYISAVLRDHPIKI